MPKKIYPYMGDAIKLVNDKRRVATNEKRETLTLPKGNPTRKETFTQWGERIKKLAPNLDYIKDDGTYNYRGAYEGGLEPEFVKEDNSYHLGSRNPITGEILKSEKHPSFKVSVEEDMKRGYETYRGTDGKIYSHDKNYLDKNKDKVKEYLGIYEGGILPEVKITAKAPTYIKYKQAWGKENPFDIDKYVEDRFNNPVGREAISRINERAWREYLRQEGLKKRQAELDEATKMGLLYQRFNPQRRDDIFIADEQFQKRYGTSPHRYRYDNDPEYKKYYEQQARNATSKIDYPSTDLRRKDVVDPNNMWMYSNLTGESKKTMTDFSNVVIGMALPIPVLESMGKIPSVFKLGKKLIKPVSKVVGKTDDAIKAGSKVLNKTDGIIKNPPKFKSEIDWGKWNKEIPSNKPLMDEYLQIEKNTKQNGTWMKNPNGSTFKGTPEQFVQQNSNNFKKAFGDSKLLNDDGSPMKVYHGSAKKFDIFDESKFQLGDSGYSGKGIYTTPSKTKADSYALSSGSFHSGEKIPTTYELYGRANNPIRSSELPEGYDLFDFHREKNWQGDVPIQKQLKDYDAAIANKRGMIDRIYPDKDAAEIVFPTNKQLKSAIGNNGMFDMSNPNIYKGIIPPTLLLYLQSQNKKEQ